ncbi:hypothetical protein FRB95_002515 [Tulasnella sp. JGI-2019a]|nr:hypothetical protein FRB95_002515 [Tulasnella sp. JGI-2019a]
MPSTTTLALSGNSDQCIALLSQPALNNNNQYEWVLPNLQGLSLEACPRNSLQLLKDLSGNRQGGSEMDGGNELQLGLLRKLEKINIRMMDMYGQARTGPFYQDLRQLKGDTWDGHTLHL